ncbi:deoxyribonuclease-1-like 1 [Aplochiton taeniatus]
MKPSFSLLLLLLCLVCVCGVQTTLFRICAFNVQSFGESKSANADVMDTLVRIISRCDICLLQEVRDNKQKAIPALMDALNTHNTKYDYASVASERLGRSVTYQEQYVFLYRTKTVTVTGQYQYPDTLPENMDAFSREPFVVRFKAPKTEVKEFVLVPQHTTPANATKEIDALYDVFLDIKSRWKTENVMFLGDFNADCGYVAKKNRKHVRLISDPTFVWLIGDETDTTVRESTNCAYDRIVVSGESLPSAIEPLSAMPFDFAKEYRLTEAQALEVSDHYPVEVQLKAGSSKRQEVSFLLLLFLIVFVITTST